jgi:hypothetical protein
MAKGSFRKNSGLIVAAGVPPASGPINMSSLVLSA